MPKLTPSRVLLVEDDPSLRSLLSEQLEEAGFEAHEAEDGIDGLMKLRNELPKVIISDLQMPRMSGIEFISVLRQRFPFIPVILLSGSIPGEVLAEVRPDACFEKGELSINDLVQVLRDLVRKTPDPADLPQMVPSPVRTRLGFAGQFTLTCQDCLRMFTATGTPEEKSVERTVACTHCGATVPFLIESTQPA